MKVYRCPVLGLLHDDKRCVFSGKRHVDVTAECAALLRYLGAW